MSVRAHKDTSYLVASKSYKKNNISGFHIVELPPLQSLIPSTRIPTIKAKYLTS